MTKILFFVFAFFTLNSVFAIDPPSMIAPTNGAANQNTQVNLDWGFVTGNVGYIYEIDISADFDSPYYFKSDETSSAALVSNLFFGTTYYWRVRTKGVTDTSDWTAIWSFSTHSVPELTAPSNGAVNQHPQTTFDWVGYTGNVGYIYEIDVNPLFNSPDLISGATAAGVSQYTFSDLLFGTAYYWRMAIKNGVDTSEWSEIRTLTTLDIVDNVSPSNGAVNQHPQTGLDWGGINGNIGYIYEIDTDPSFSTTNYQTGTTPANTSNHDVTNLLFGTTYYWRAAAKTISDTSGWSNTWNFSTLSTITNVSPANGSVNQNPQLIIDWTAVTGNTGYIYQLDTSPNFNSTMLQTGNSAINVSNYTLTNLFFETTYYWRAAAKTSTDTSDWSNTWSFTTLSSVNNVSPANGSNDMPPQTTIDWTAVTGNNGYLYRADTTINFNSPLLIAGTTAVNSSEITLTDLRFENTYYWQAAVITATDTSNWSDLWSFTVIKKVENVAPANSSTNLATSVTIDWTAITGNNGYLYQVDTCEEFNSTMYFSSPTATNVSQETIENMRFGTTYYWNAACKTISDTSVWGATWSFSTLDAAVNVSPSNGANGLSINPTIDWQSMTGNLGYIYQLDITPDFSSASLVEGTTSTNVSQFSFSGLLNGNTYYWRVAIKNLVDTSGWGPIWSFTTNYLLSFAPILTSPVNEAIDIPVNDVNFTWESIAGATEYQFQYSVSADFSTSVFSETTNELFTTISGFSNNTTYYWRVRAGNGSGYSPWSSVWSFTTELAQPEIPELISPENSSTEIEINCSLVWNAATDADSYEYYYGTDYEFVAFTNGSTSNTNVELIDLEYSTTYYWKVRAFNGIVAGEWSEVWSFTTEDFVLSTPVLTSPANEAINQPISLLTMDWEDVEGVYSYEIEYSTDVNFIENLVQESSYGSLFIINSDLLYDTVYHWRIRAFDGLDLYSEWSEIWWFRTIEDPLFVEIVNAFSTVIYPNPFENLIFIENTEEELLFIEIFDVLGEKVFSIEKKKIINIETELFSSGIYYLRLHFINGKTETHKLIKN
ncbi:MAG: T9SS type A sorting domain-containing protein [Bacteroidales bacterium]|nr:T9SS type A sorting domain-containing protein [Bacteroidales bacterium]